MLYLQFKKKHDKLPVM